MSKTKVLPVSISSGNLKVAIPTFNKTCIRWEQGTTCPGCYALKAFRQYPNVRKSWQKNAEASQDTIIAETVEYVRKHQVKYFRVHSSGEFTGYSDVTTWKTIASLCPTTVFYGYSKESDLFQGNTLPENLIIRVNADINYGTQEALDAIMRNNPGKFWQCPCGMPGVNNKKICGLRCKACMLAPKGKLPLFLKH